MLNKFLSAIVLIVFSNCVMAQFINLQKNNSYIKTKIQQGQNVKIKYVTDSSVKIIKAKVIKYSFPFLTVSVKKDTLILDVRKIQYINFRSGLINLSVGFYILMVPVTILAISELTLALANTKEAGFIGPFIGSVFFTGIDYLIYQMATRKFDTQSKWSFY